MFPYEFLLILNVLAVTYTSESDAHESFRWNSSWLLMGSCLTLGTLYCIWLPLTALGKIPQHFRQDSERGSERGSDRRELVEYHQFSSTYTKLDPHIDAASAVVIEENMSVLHNATAATATVTTVNKKEKECDIELIS